MIEIHRQDPWLEGADPVHIGLLMVSSLPDGGLEISNYLRPDATDEEEAAFSEWVDSRVVRFVQSGPEPDGWMQRKSDGRCQLWARVHDFGELADM